VIECKNYLFIKHLLIKRVGVIEEMTSDLLLGPALARSFLFETIEIFGINHIKLIVFANKNTR